MTIDVLDSGNRFVGLPEERHLATQPPKEKRAGETKRQPDIVRRRFRSVVVGGGGGWERNKLRK